MNLNRGLATVFVSIFVLLGATAAVFSQSNTSTYQGKLTDGAIPANGTYLMQFSLFDAVSGGTQIGPTLSFDGGLDPPAIQVVNGIFTVQLDFGVPTPPTDNIPRWDGNPRWISIAVRKVGEVSFTPLTPRQPVTSSPYAIKSASASSADTATTASTADNALNLGGFAASQYVIATDPRLSDARTPTAGSTSYIQNGASSQPLSNFNISGNGTVGGRFSTGGSVQTGDTMSITSSVANPFAVRAYSSSNGSAVEGLITGGNTALPAVFGLYSGSGTGAGVSGLNTLFTGTGVVAAGQGTSPTFLAAGSGLASNGLDTGVYAATISPGAAQAILSSNFGTIVRVNYWNGATQFKINGAGAVSTIVRDAEQKERIMFAPEAPEVLFEDYGTGKLIDGKAQIVLDPTLAANISVNDRHPLKVFIQLEGDCNGVYVTNKTATGFEVIELQSGKSNVSFTWHVIGNRADEELKGDLVGPGGKTIKRISHYEDLRFPFQTEGPSILRTEANTEKPREK